MPDEKPIKRKTPKILKYTYKYFDETSVHGMKYMYLENSNFRKLLWFILCGGGISFCFLLVSMLLSGFNTNYTQVNLASSAFPVWEDAFPGVSICNYNIVYKKHTTKVINLLKSLGFEEVKIMNYLSNLNRLIICNNCNNTINENFDVDLYVKIQNALDKAGYDLNTMMKELAQPCENMLKRCSWKSKQVKCMDVFKFVKTSNGFCCSFSYFGSTDVQNKDEETGRLYTGGAGVNYGLTVVLDSESNEYISSIKNIKGFDVLVRNGNDFANMRLISKTLSAGEELQIGLYVSTTKSEPDVKYMDPIKRGCLFKNEGSLRWSKLYTFQNCLSECRTIAIHKFCHCIPYMFPVNDTSIKVCTLADVPCLRQNELNFSSMVVMSEIGPEIISKIDKRVGNASKCHCLPDCDEIKYEFFIDRSEAYVPGYTNVSVLSVFFNSISSTMSSRSVTVPWDIFVASIGGVFGLCLGASVMSLLELLYHFINGILDAKIASKRKSKVLKIIPKNTRNHFRSFN